MFKVNNQEVKNEKVNIKLVEQEETNYNDGDVTTNSFNTLSFDITGDNYSFCFDLNCKLDKLLELPIGESINFNDYIFGGETFFNVNDENGIEPIINITITRYINNEFKIFLTFDANYEYDGIIEFNFNLDDVIMFNKIVTELDLGTLLEQPTRVSGGLTHKMYKVITNKGKYIIKLLNPNIMKRPTALDNFNRADNIEEILKENNIPAIYSIKFNNNKLQLIDNQYFYVYEWYDGKTLKDNDITIKHCEIIGNVLANIHNIDIKEETFIRDEINIDWEYYIDLAKTNNSPIYDLIYDKLDILNDSMNKGNMAIKKLPNIISICHNDMDSKNVMWINNDFRLIDLECLGYSNPYLELFELALCWSGYESCNIDFNLFKTFIDSYFNNSKLNKNINFEDLYYANYGRLEWLEFNIKRSLMIECDSKEEQELGINEVKETIEHIVYYDKIKEQILKNVI